MLSKQIKSFFDLSVSAKFDGVSSEHPIIVLNSIKNIIGDNRKNPSKLLLDFAEKKANQYPLRDDDKEILQEVAKEGVGNSVFISDLEAHVKQETQKSLNKRLHGSNGLAIMDWED